MFNTYINDFTGVHLKQFEKLSFTKCKHWSTINDYRLKHNIETGVYWDHRAWNLLFPKEDLGELNIQYPKELQDAFEQFKATYYMVLACINSSWGSKKDAAYEQLKNLINSKV